MEQEICAICKSRLVDPTILSCKHQFCWVCINEWVHVNPICPLCTIKLTDIKSKNGRHSLRNLENTLHQHEHSESIFPEFNSPSSESSEEISYLPAESSKSSQVEEDLSDEVLPSVNSYHLRRLPTRSLSVIHNEHNDRGKKRKYNFRSNDKE